MHNVMYILLYDIQILYEIFSDIYSAAQDISCLYWIRTLFRKFRHCTLSYATSARLLLYTISLRSILILSIHLRLIPQVVCYVEDFKRKNFPYVYCFFMRATCLHIILTDLIKLTIDCVKRSERNLKLLKGM